MRYRVSRLIIYETDTYHDMARWMARNQPVGLKEIKGGSMRIVQLPSMWSVRHILRALFTRPKAEEL